MTTGHAALDTGTTMLLARRVHEEDTISAWQKEKGLYRQALISPVTIISAVIFLSISFFIGILPNLEAIQNNTISTYDAVRLIIGVTLSLLAIIALPYIAAPTAINAMLNAKKSMRETRSTAKNLGNEIVPILTIAHVEARIRIDESLKQKRKELGKTAPRKSDSNDIAALLFENLNRENTIISLITNRGITTAEGIKKELADIETHPTPLWDGAL